MFLDLFLVMKLLMKNTICQGCPSGDLWATCHPWMADLQLPDSGSAAAPRVIPTARAAGVFELPFLPLASMFCTHPKGKHSMGTQGRPEPFDMRCSAEGHLCSICPEGTWSPWMRPMERATPTSAVCWVCGRQVFRHWTVPVHVNPDTFSSNRDWEIPEFAFPVYIFKVKSME